MEVLMTTRYENMRLRIQHLAGGVPLVSKEAAIVHAFCEELDRLEKRMQDMCPETEQLT